MDALYDRVRRNAPRGKRPLPLSVVLGAAVLALLLIAAAIVHPMLQYRRYMAFISSLSEDTVYAAAHDCLRCDRPNQSPVRLTMDNAYAVYNKLLATGNGSEGGNVPESDGALLSYGNGATLELWPKTFSGGGRRDGLMVRYTGVDGNTFVYATNRTSFTYFTAVLTPSQNRLWED